MSKVKQIICQCTSIFFSCRTNKVNRGTVPGDLPVVIPKSTDIQIDGRLNDWTNKNTSSVYIFSDEYGRIPEQNDLLASMNMAWNERGMFLAIRVNDNFVIEDTINKNIFNGDCIELFFGDSVGGRNLLQFIVSPFGQKTIWDHRGQRKLLQFPASIRFASRVTNAGYIIEALIPFEQIGINPDQPGRPGLQINIVDNDSINDKNRKNIKWFYTKETYFNTWALYPVSLRNDKYVNINYNLRAYFNGDSLNVKVMQKGKMLSNIKLIQPDGKVLYTGELTDGEYISIPMKYSYDLQDILVYNEKRLLGKLVPDFLPRIDRQLYPNESYIRILNYKEKVKPSAKNQIVFVGHSMIRYWYTMREDLKGFPVINKGFGGSQSHQVNHFYNELIKPLQPKLIVYMEGSNDISTGKKPTDVSLETEKLIHRVTAERPETGIALVSHQLAKYPILKAKKLAKVDSLHYRLSKKYANVDYIDATTCITGKDGKIYRDIFHPDNSHLNQKGYIYFAQPIREYLEQRWNKQ